LLLIMNRPTVAPSLLAADFSDMASAVALVASSGADWVHLDVMDGRFVPNLTFGPKMASDLRSRSGLPFDVHLMTLEPDRLVASFAEAGADWITFHIEAAVHAHRLCSTIRAAGARPGVSLVPSTPLSSLEEILPFVDLVLVMTVNPGFGGQDLIPSCLDKVRRLSKMREERGLAFRISVDGGVNRVTLPGVVAAGTDIVVLGSAFFGSSDPAAEVKFAKHCAEYPGRGD
jgi:ribulose-phosphate 3-epimerase